MHSMAKRQALAIEKITKACTQRKGTAGLNVLLSVICMLFVIGILVMCFMLVGSHLKNSDSVYTTSATYTATNESHLMNGTIGYFDLTASSLRDAACTITRSIANASDGVIIGSRNYSVSNCRISNLTSTYNAYYWNVTYTYNYQSSTDAVDVINDTMNAMKESTNFFGIIIIIASIVVVILLLVIVIVSLRQSGMMGG